MLAKILYDLLVNAIEKACASHGFLEVCDFAAQLGMAGGRVNSFNALRYEFVYADNEGGSVALNIRSYDPSGPFQNEPDINRFTVNLLIGTRVVDSHDQQYED